MGRHRCTELQHCAVRMMSKNTQHDGLPATACANARGPENTKEKQFFFFFLCFAIGMLKLRSCESRAARALPSGGLCTLHLQGQRLDMTKPRPITLERTNARWSADACASQKPLPPRKCQAHTASGTSYFCYLYLVWQPGDIARCQYGDTAFHRQTGRTAFPSERPPPCCSCSFCCWCPCSRCRSSFSCSAC